MRFDRTVSFYVPPNLYTATRLLSLSTQSESFSWVGRNKFHGSRFLFYRHFILIIQILCVYRVYRLGFSLLSLNSPKYSLISKYSIRIYVRADIYIWLPFCWAIKDNCAGCSKLVLYVLKDEVFHFVSTNPKVHFLGLLGTHKWNEIVRLSPDWGYG